MKKNFLKTAAAALVFLSMTMFILPALSADGPKKLAILPFNMNADRDLAFLQEGILDMLASRLAWKGKVEILEKGIVKKEVSKLGTPLNNETAVAAGKALGADYVILGSLTVFGESVSIDAKIFSVADAQQLITAFNQSKGMDEVIPTINQFGQDINAKIMGRPVRAPVTYATGYYGEQGGGIISVRERLEAGEVTHSQVIKGDIASIDVGDVDGDGKNELVAVGGGAIQVYKWAESTFTLFKSVSPKWSAEYISVSVADLDGNGKAEIYASNMTNAGVSSVVLEWDGGGLKKVVDNEPYFFNVALLPGKGQRLLGQRRVASGGFRDTVYLLKYGNRDISSEESLELPHMANVYNFVRANITGTGEETLVLNATTEILFLFDKEGEELWSSEDAYGGLDTHMVVPGSSLGEEKWVHFSPPILISDADADGVSEFVICKNESASYRLLEKQRYFTSGALYFLSWDGATLATKFKTPKLGGPVTGYRIADVDNDKKPELIISVALRTTSAQKLIGKSGRSRIITYDLDVEGEKK